MTSAYVNINSQWVNLNNVLGNAVNGGMFATYGSTTSPANVYGGTWNAIASFNLTSSTTGALQTYQSWSNYGKPIDFTFIGIQGYYCSILIASKPRSQYSSVFCWTYRDPYTVQSGHTFYDINGNSASYRIYTSQPIFTSVNSIWRTDGVTALSWSCYLKCIHMSSRVFSSSKLNPVLYSIKVNLCRDTSDGSNYYFCLSSLPNVSILLKWNYGFTSQTSVYSVTFLLEKSPTFNAQNIIYSTVTPSIYLWKKS